MGELTDACFVGQGKSRKHGPDTEFANNKIAQN
jgi:hypothetical protein